METSFGAQGRTVQRAILGMSSQSLGATNQEQLYVSASRAKETVSLYTDDKAAVMEAVQRSSRKLAALDLLSDQQKAEEKRRRLLTGQQERQRRLGLIARLRSAWERVMPPQPPRMPPTHLNRLGQQEQGNYHER